MIWVTVASDGTEATLYNDSDTEQTFQLLDGWTKNGPITLASGETRTRNVRDARVLATDPPFEIYEPALAGETEDGLHEMRREQGSPEAVELEPDGVGEPAVDSVGGERLTEPAHAVEQPVEDALGVVEAPPETPRLGDLPRTMWVGVFRPPPHGFKTKAVYGAQFPMISLLRTADAVELITAGGGHRIHSPNNLAVIGLYGEE